MLPDATHPSMCVDSSTTAQARTRLYRRGTLERQGFSLDEIPALRHDRDAVVWLDLCAPDRADLDLVAAEFGLDALAVEDAVSAHERPKVDHYRGYVFLNAYAARLDVHTGVLSRSEVAAFVLPRALVTIRKDDGFDVDELTRRWDASPELAVHGVAFLLHGLLDLVVDGHFAAVQSLDDEIEELEDTLFDTRRKSVDVQRRSFELRKSLVTLRRVVLPMREVVNTLLRGDLHVVDEGMQPYFHDVYDHVLRATEWTESLRDLVTTILETHLTIQGNRLNDIMKKLTSWAAIIAVPTAVTGFFGQNVPYPGFEERSGFWASLVLMVGIATLLWVAFRRRGWL